MGAWSLTQRFKMSRLVCRFLFLMLLLTFKVITFLLWAHLDVLRQLCAAALERFLGQDKRGSIRVDCSFVQQAQIDLDEFGGCIKL